jgi:hypothetical protein
MPEKADWSADQAKTSQIAGAEFYFERSLHSRQHLFSPGPILQAVLIIIEVQKGTNPGFDYEFYHPDPVEQTISYGRK